jgi:hypothetical protein
LYVGNAGGDTRQERGSTAESEDRILEGNGLFVPGEDEHLRHKV